MGVFKNKIRNCAGDMKMTFKSMAIKWDSFYGTVTTSSVTTSLRQLDISGEESRRMVGAAV